MSVLVKKLPTSDPKQVEVYVKGSPEKIKQLCLPETGMLHTRTHTQRETHTRTYTNTHACARMSL